jgi:hypothetical protein
MSTSVVTKCLGKLSYARLQDCRIVSWQFSKFKNITYCQKLYFTIVRFFGGMSDTKYFNL